MRDIKEMARQVKMPYDYVTGEPFYLEKLEAFAELVRAEALAEQPAHAPVEWMEMVVANLVREGVNKHRARELAQHFYTSPPAVPDAIGPNEDELPSYAAGWNDCRALMLEMRKP